MDYKVSVIIPSYKRTFDLVNRAVQSVLNQTYKNLEIILVDDNAKIEHQNFRNELERLVSSISDDRLVYIQNDENLGGSGSRNVGIYKSTGEFVTFLDDDDLYLPEKVEKQLEFMIENSLDVSFGKLNIYNENDKLIDVREHDIPSFYNKYLQKYHLLKPIAGTPSFMIKREVLVNVGGFDIVPMGQEWYLMHKIIQTDCKIGYFAECYLKAYRTSTEGISTGKNKIIGEKKLYEFRKGYFNVLNLSERRYVRCRHYAVMAVAYRRNKKYVKCLLNLAFATLCDPILAIKEAFGLKKRLKKVK